MSQSGAFGEMKLTEEEEWSGKKWIGEKSECVCVGGQS